LEELSIYKLSINELNSRQIIEKVVSHKIVIISVGSYIFVLK